MTTLQKWSAKYLNTSEYIQTEISGTEPANVARSAFEAGARMMQEKCVALLRNEAKTWADMDSRFIGESVDELLLALVKIGEAEVRE